MTEFNRRTLVRGAAWSIPVVAVAANAPAFAASTDAPSVVSATACKDPGDPAGNNCQGYRVTLSMLVQPSDAWTLTLTSVTVTYPSKDSFSFAPIPAAFTDVTTLNNLLTFKLCTQQNSGDKFTLSVTYTATNQRTSASTTGLTGSVAVDVASRC